MINMPRTGDVENKRSNGIHCLGCQNWGFGARPDYGVFVGIWRFVSEAV